MTPSATSRLSWLTGDAVKNLVKTLQLATIEGMDAVDSYFLRNYMPTLVIIGIDCIAVVVEGILNPRLARVQSFACNMLDCILIHIFSNLSSSCSVIVLSILKVIIPFPFRHFYF